MTVRKNQDIEALRAYAILITIAAHGGYLIPSWTAYLAYFWLGGGVDLFFCISGYVITRSLMEHTQSGSSRTFPAFASSFWIRRVFRLWPAALIWSAFSVICAYNFNKLGIFGPSEDISITAATALFQMVNVRLILCLNQITSSCAPDALWHYWSLSLEEQFYFVYPFMFFYLSRRQLFAVALLGLVIQMPMARTFPSWTWFYRTDAILFGIMIALCEPSSWFQYAKNVCSRNARSVRVVSALLAVLIIVLARPQVASFYHGVIAWVAGCLVLLAALDRDLAVPFPIIKPLLSYVGARSYSIYLTHMPMFCLSREIAFRIYGTGEQTWLQGSAIIVIAFALTVVTSEASFRVIETPLRNFGRQIGSSKQGRLATLDSRPKEPVHEPSA